MKAYSNKPGWKNYHRSTNKRFTNTVLFVCSYDHLSLTPIIKWVWLQDTDKAFGGLGSGMVNPRLSFPLPYISSGTTFYTVFLIVGWSLCWLCGGCFGICRKAVNRVDFTMIKQRILSIWSQHYDKEMTHCREISKQFY